MKKSKLKLITKILALVVICLISFIGVYVQRNNRMKNVIRGYDLTKDLKGYRQIIFELSDATEVLDKDGKVIGNTDKYDDETIKTNSYKKSKTLVNKKDDLQKDNYEKTKTIIEKRLKLMGIEDYNLSLDKETGKLYLQISEDDKTEYVISNIIETGSFEIKDSEDDTTYITNKNIKNVSKYYQPTETGTVVCFSIQLDKEGTSILKDLSTNKYATIKQDSKETDKEIEEDEKTSEEKEEVKQNKVNVIINDSVMDTTSYDEPIQNGTIRYSVGSASTDNKQLDEYSRTASTIVTLLDSGEMPLIYKVTYNQYLETDIKLDMMMNVVYVVGTIIAILLVFMIIKNKLKGLLGVISYIGFVAIYLLLIRYTNVAISISGIIAIAMVFIINYMLSMKLISISIDDNKTYKQEYIKMIVKMIPILIVSIVFVFMKWVALSSFGMLLFWGIALMMLYNILVTKNIVE